MGSAARRSGRRRQGRGAERIGSGGCRVRRRRRRGEWGGTWVDCSISKVKIHSPSRKEGGWGQPASRTRSNGDREGRRGRVRGVLCEFDQVSNELWGASRAATDRKGSLLPPRPLTGCAPALWR